MPVNDKRCFYQPIHTSSCIKVLVQRSNQLQSKHSLAISSLLTCKALDKKLMMFSWPDYQIVKTNIYNRKFTEQLLFSFHKSLIMVDPSRLSSFTCSGLVWIGLFFHWKSYIGDSVLRQKNYFRHMRLEARVKNCWVMCQQ